MAEPETWTGLVVGGERADVDAVEVLGVPSYDRWPAAFVLVSLLAAMPCASACVIPLPVMLNLFANLLLVFVPVALTPWAAGFLLLLTVSSRACIGIYLDPAIFFSVLLSS